MVYSAHDSVGQTAGCCCSKSKLYFVQRAWEVRRNEGFLCFLSTGRTGQCEESGFVPNKVQQDLVQQANAEELDSL